MRNKPVVLVSCFILAIVCICCFCLTSCLMIVRSASTVRNIDITDTFDDNRYEWTVGASNNSYARLNRQITAGKYQWNIESLKTEKLSAIANPKIEQASSMSTSVDVHQLEASDSTNFNLYVHYQDENNYYALKVNRKYQQYTIGMLLNGEWTDWLKWTRSVVVNYDQSNNLKIISMGDSHTFYVNGKEVFKKTDTSIAKGGAAVGVQVYEQGQTGTWEFDNFTYQKLG